MIKILSQPLCLLPASLLIPQSQWGLIDSDSAGPERVLSYLTCVHHFPCHLFSESACKSRDDEIFLQEDFLSQPPARFAPLSPSLVSLQGALRNPIPSYTLSLVTVFGKSRRGRRGYKDIEISLWFYLLTSYPETTGSPGLKVYTSWTTPFSIIASKGIQEVIPRLCQNFE